MDTAEENTQVAGENQIVTDEEPFDYSKLDEIFSDYPRERRFLIPILQRIQVAYRYLPAQALQVLMEDLGFTRAEIFGVISFYPGFMITEPGKYILKVCMGTACFVKGADLICEKIDEKYHIKVGETDGNKLFTLQTASCLGNCGAAPMLLVGDDVFGNLDPDATLETLSPYKKD